MGMDNQFDQNGVYSFDRRPDVQDNINDGGFYIQKILNERT